MELNGITNESISPRQVKQYNFARYPLIVLISDRDIRQRIKKGETIKGLVPECIENDVKMFYSKI